MARILVIEDNPLNLKLASVILRSEGHDVHGATDANEAETIVAAGVPDLILMDLGLPGKDGFALTRELRSAAATALVPIIAVTSFAMAGDRRRAIDAGCSEYLTKPIDRTTLVESVRKLLRPKRESQKGDKHDRVEPH